EAVLVPQTVPALFDAAARQHPQRPALSEATGHWSYAALEAAANRLAHYLIGQGVRPESRVAVCLDRNAHWVVALLGVMKAGGIYVRIDPDFHPERTRHVLADADCTLCLSGRAHAAVLGEQSASLR